MKLKVFTAIAVLAGLTTVSGNTAKEEERKGRGRPDMKQLLEKYDTDKDGKLSAKERKAAGEARKAEFLKKFDKDKDGKLSAEERKAAYEAMKGRRGSRPEGRNPRPEGRKPEGRKPRPDRKPGKKPATAKKK